MNFPLTRQAWFVQIPRLRRIGDYILSVMKHGWALSTTVLGSFILSIPSWIEPLLSPAHAKTLNGFVTVSAGAYRDMAVAFLFFGLLYANFLAWDETREKVEGLRAERDQYVTTQKDGILTSLLDPARRSQDDSTDAMRELAREMKRQQRPEIFAYAIQRVIGTREGRPRVDVGLEVVNSGADTSLSNWQITVGVTVGNQHTAIQASFAKDDILPPALAGCGKTDDQRRWM